MPIRHVVKSQQRFGALGPPHSRTGMTFDVLYPVMLLGLAGMAIPIIIHLLHRRRYQVVDWGAMQFLQVSSTTRRRLLVEELLLLALRMGLIGVMVWALASPFVAGSAVTYLGGSTNRDLVLLFDGSCSMGLDDGKHKPPQEAAQAWATDLLDTLTAGDSVVVLQAGQQVVKVLAEPTQDLQLARQKIARLPEPRGVCDWPRALQEAHAILAAKSKRSAREIIVLTDGRLQGWADSTTLARWERLAGQLKESTDPLRPRIWLVNVGDQRSQASAVPNYALKPLRPARGITAVGQELRIKTAIAVTGQDSYQPPHRIRLEIDGQKAGDLPPPGRPGQGASLVPMQFSCRLPAPGVHLVSVILEPDPPRDQRTSHTPLRDLLPGDNLQDLAVEVVGALPVLLVDGDAALTPESSTYFVRKALALSPDPKRPPAVVTRAVSVRDFDGADLSKEVDAGRPGSSPRVLVLADVPYLSSQQQQAVDEFLDKGGGVLVSLGQRVEKARDHYNQELYRDGRGWLPAWLLDTEGDRSKPEQAAAFDLGQLYHPVLDLFRDNTTSSLDRARFPRWWRVGVDRSTQVSVGAFLTTGDPLLVEQAYKQGKVILCAVPLDRSWDATFPRLGEFPVLMHELVYYLADTRSAEHNLQPGQPLRYQPDPARDGFSANIKLPGSVTLFPPGDGPRPERVERWPLVIDNARAPGPYRLQIAEGRSVFYVIQPAQQEMDLRMADGADFSKVARLLPFTNVKHVAEARAEMVGADKSEDLWWLAMLGVVGLLCSEVFLTRRMAAGRVRAA
jgi:hypothetical protein